MNTVRSQQVGRVRVEARALDTSLAHGEVLARAHAQSARSARAGRGGELDVREAHRERLTEELRREPVLAEAERGRPRPEETAVASAGEPAPAGPDMALQSVQAPGQPGGAERRAEAVAALVERIEAALKGDRPSLTLSLNEGSSTASVEIVRVARGEVTVRIEARGQATGTASPSELRQALAARGLRVRSLEIVRR